jgi:hypothetical protein
MPARKANCGTCLTIKGPTFRLRDLVKQSIQVQGPTAHFTADSFFTCNPPYYSEVSGLQSAWRVLSMKPGVTEKHKEEYAKSFSHAYMC